MSVVHFALGFIVGATVVLYNVAKRRLNEKRQEKLIDENIGRKLDNE